MGWFFSSDDEDDNNDEGLFSGGLFSGGGFSLGDLIGSIFSGGLFGSVFGEPEIEEEEPDPLAHLSQKERDFFEKIKIVLGEDSDQINPDSIAYEAHKMRLYFELEDEMLFSDLSRYELGLKHRERELYCNAHDLCPRCYEKLENGVCQYC